MKELISFYKWSILWYQKLPSWKTVPVLYMKYGKWLPPLQKDNFLKCVILGTG